MTVLMHHLKTLNGADLCAIFDFSSVTTNIRSITTPFVEQHIMLVFTRNNGYIET